MKNQYVGDVNDYRKFGLLRGLQSRIGWSMLVVWMLTPDDGRNDGSKTDYLDRPDRWRRYDPKLFDALSSIVHQNGQRTVAALGELGLLPNARYFGEPVPRKTNKRARWLLEVLRQASKADLVFLDPDNGMEVESVRLGSKNSHKYVYFHELSALWFLGRSLLIYQHFPRKQHAIYLYERSQQLIKLLPKARVTAIKAKSVAFFLVLQPHHAGRERFWLEEVAAQWKGQLTVSGSP